MFFGEFGWMDFKKGKTSGIRVYFSEPTKLGRK